VYITNRSETLNTGVQGSAKKQAEIKQNKTKPTQNGQPKVRQDAFKSSKNPGASVSQGQSEKQSQIKISMDRLLDRFDKILKIEMDKAQIHEQASSFGLHNLQITYKGAGPSLRFYQINEQSSPLPPLFKPTTGPLVAVDSTQRIPFPFNRMPFTLNRKIFTYGTRLRLTLSRPYSLPPTIR